MRTDVARLDLHNRRHLILLRPRVMSVCRLACSVLSVKQPPLPDTLGEHCKIVGVADPEAPSRAQTTARGVLIHARPLPEAERGALDLREGQHIMQEGICARARPEEDRGLSPLAHRGGLAA